MTGLILDCQECKVSSSIKDESKKTARMRRLIGVFVWLTCQKVRFLTLRLIYTLYIMG